MDHPLAAPPLPDIQIDTPPAAETQLEPPYRIILHNDDITPFDFVILVLRTVFHISAREALYLTLQAHSTGQAYVATLPLEEAKYRVGQAHGQARAAGYPLTFTIQPDSL
jgi:ATP-dependent Clp protease adaptor protein ClpS